MKENSYYNEYAYDSRNSNTFSQYTTATMSTATSFAPPAIGRIFGKAGEFTGTGFDEDSFRSPVIKDDQNAVDMSVGSIMKRKKHFGSQVKAAVGCVLAFLTLVGVATVAVFMSGEFEEFIQQSPTPSPTLELTLSPTSLPTSSPTFAPTETVFVPMTFSEALLRSTLLIPGTPRIQDSFVVHFPEVVLRYSFENIFIEEVFCDIQSSKCEFGVLTDGNVEDACNITTCQPLKTLSFGSTQVTLEEGGVMDVVSTECDEQRRSSCTEIDTVSSLITICLPERPLIGTFSSSICQEVLDNFESEEFDPFDYVDSGDFYHPGNDFPFYYYYDFFGEIDEEDFFYYFFGDNFNPGENYYDFNYKFDYYYYYYYWSHDDNNNTGSDYP